MHTCIIANIHTHAQIAMGMRVAFTPHFRERKLPLWAWAGRAVLARRVRARAGAGACCMLGRKGRACLLVSDDRQEVCERLQQVLWALQGPLCIVAGASYVL